jgi:hypothetical protein
MAEIEHPQARVLRLATAVVEGAQTTPELDAVVGLLKPVLAARKAQDLMNKHDSEYEKRRRRLGEKET